MSTPNTAKLVEHIERLCSAHEITIGNHSSGGRAYRKGKTIKIRPVKSPVTYFVALHEIAHVVYGPAGHGLRLEKEGHAWDWAISKAILPVTPPVQRMIFRSLESYRAWSARSLIAKVPPRDHVFWTLLESLRD